MRVAMFDFMTAGEVAELLRVSLPTLARWRAADPVQGPPFVRVESSIRYPRDGVDKWLQERTQGGTVGA